jgi:predicted DNA-binding transcriptional regulator YafY
VSSEVLGEVALACRDHERIRFRYESAFGSVTHRRVEPHALAPADRHWYLLCWDLDRDDWRTFRVDRIEAIEHTRVLFAPKPLTPEEIDEFVLIASAWHPHPVEGAAIVDLPLADFRDAFGQWSQGAEAVGANRTSWPLGGGDFRDIAYALGWIPAGVEYRLEIPEDTREEMREALSRMLRALDAARAH